MPTVALLVFAAAFLAKPAATPSPSPSSPVVAVLDGQPITAEEIETVGGAGLTKARLDWYNAQRGAAEELIARRLIEKEAKARNITTAELMRVEVETKVPPVSPEEQKNFYEANKARYFQNVPEA